MENQNFVNQNQNAANHCSNCGAELAQGQAFCASCGTPVPKEEPKNICANCGNELAADAAFCAMCGAASSAPPQAMPKVELCSNCGHELPANAEFCGYCGHRKGNPAPNPVNNATPAGNINPAVSQYNATVAEKPKKKKTWIPIVIGAAIVLAIIIGIGAGGSGGSSGGGAPIVDPGPNLREVHTAIGGDTYYCDLATDGSYLAIDTNPMNLDDFSSSTAWNMIQKAVRELDLPESVLTKMQQTRALDGRQTHTTSDLTVSWTYHPDQGLEVMFELNQ